MSVGRLNSGRRLIESVWALFCAASMLVGCVDADASGLPAAPLVTRPRLYVLDCGTLIYNRPEDYGLTREEVASTNMAVTCYLVVHPKGMLLFDTGLADTLVGRPIWENIEDGYAKLKLNTLRGQLADIGVTPGMITYLALSHSDWDHVGNANDFAGAIWLTPRAEREVMFGPRATAGDRPLFQALEHAHSVVYDGDHDVFGDGTVVLKFAPGHTPGHQCLYVKLADTGGIVLSGDLYHYPEERTLHRMPKEEAATGTIESRASIEKFMEQTHSQLWIGHSIAFFRDALKSPAWYE